MSLPLAHNELKSIAERDHPALAAQRSHLSDVIHVNDRIAVNPLGIAGLSGVPRSRFRVCVASSRCLAVMIHTITPSA